MTSVETQSRTEAFEQVLDEISFHLGAQTDQFLSLLEEVFAITNPYGIDRVVIDLSKLLRKLPATFYQLNPLLHPYARVELNPRLSPIINYVLKILDTSRIVFLDFLQENASQFHNFTASRLQEILSNTVPGDPAHENLYNVTDPALKDSLAQLAQDILDSNISKNCRENVQMFLQRSGGVPPSLLRYEFEQLAPFHFTGFSLIDDPKTSKIHQEQALHFPRHPAGVPPSLLRDNIKSGELVNPDAQGNEDGTLIVSPGSFTPQPGLSKQISWESLVDPEDGTLWVHSVPPEIVASVSKTERKRQEAINEVIYTERNFVRDLEYLRDVWMVRLQESEVIPAERRNDFIQQVFWNVRDILAVNTRLRDALNKRQKSYAIVDRIGDIFLEHVPHFGPFVAYGAHQLYGKYEFEREKDQNPSFARFVDTTERLPESRKLELQAYLTKPTTRLARYPLLLESVLKHTPDDSLDKTVIPEVIAMVRNFLANVNLESGKVENRFNLAQLDNQLIFKPGEEVDLRLKEPGRQMVYKGGLQQRDGEILVNLFDHVILFTKIAKKLKNKHHGYLRVYRRPIPLELLTISFSQTGLVEKSSFSRDHRGSGTIVPPVRNDAKGPYWINFQHLGRKAYNLVLLANSASSQRRWVECIQKQQELVRERSTMFDSMTLSEGFFGGPNKVNCAAPFSGGRRVVYGTDNGVYLSDLREPGGEPVKVLSLLKVSQVDVLEDYQLLIVLSERQVITFPLDALDPADLMAGLKRAKRISSHTSFFKTGYCLGRILVCIVKSSQLSSTFKALEPIDQNIRGRSKSTFRKLLQGGNDTLKPFREFYIPMESTSIHYLKTKMCVGCSRGFEIVDLESLETQGLLDPVDAALDFVRIRENSRPMALYQIQNEFLLCYNEFAFYVNKSGRRARSEFMVYWEGVPTAFALHEPYILAFEPNFIEIRHIETGYLAQVIQGSNLRLLFADTPPTSTSARNAVHPQNMGMQPYGGGGYGGYGPPPQVYSGQGGPGGPWGHGRQTPLFGGRDEILVCSDDRVFALRPAAVRNSQAVLPDNASWTSIPR